MGKTVTRKPSLNLPGRLRRSAIAPPSEMVETSRLRPDDRLPLVYRPNVPDLELSEWAASHRAAVEAQLDEHGALLFRGFDVRNPEQFERFAAAFCRDLFNENGEHPRRSVSGNVYTPVFYPPERQLLWHNENSFNHRWPSKIWFCCMQPAAEGGETPLADSRRVYQLLDPAIKRRFAEKHVMYVRNYDGQLGLDWQTVFRTDDRAEVERRCRESGMEATWKAGDRLRTQCVRPAAVRHPRTGEDVWFNQAQHWHVACLDETTRQVFRSSFADADLPRHCYYGDGSPIEDGVMHEILEVYRQLEVVFAWQPGDIVMLDNLSTAHGRNAYAGERRLLVAMGAMMSYADVRTSTADVRPSTAGAQTTRSEA